MSVNLIIERLRDWSYGAFLNETTAECIAVGLTAEEARENGMRELQRRAALNSSVVVYGELARPSND